MKKLLYIVLLLVIAALLVACEQEPGEITGRTAYSDGRPASVRIKVVDSKGNIAWEGSSDYTSGSWYTGSVIRAGHYTIYYFKSGGEQIEGKEQEVTVQSAGSQAMNQTF